MDPDQHLDKTHGTDGQNSSTQAEDTQGAAEPKGNSQQGGLLGAILRSSGTTQGTGSSESAENSHEAGTATERKQTASPNQQHASMIPESFMHPGSGDDSTTTVLPNVRHLSLLDTSALMAFPTRSAAESTAQPADQPGAQQQEQQTASGSAEPSPAPTASPGAPTPQPGRSLPYQPIRPSSPASPSPQVGNSETAAVQTAAAQTPASQPSEHQRSNTPQPTPSEVTVKAGDVPQPSGSSGEGQPHNAASSREKLQPSRGITVGAAAQGSTPGYMEQSAVPDQPDRIYQPHSDQQAQNTAPAAVHSSSRTPGARDTAMMAAVAASIAKSQREALASYGVQKPTYVQPAAPASSTVHTGTPGTRPSSAAAQPASPQRPSPKPHSAAPTAEVPAAESQAQPGEVYPAPAQLPGYEKQEGKPFERPAQAAAPATSTPTPVSGLWITWVLAALLVVAIFGAIAMAIAWRGAVDKETPAPETVTQSVTIIKTPSSTVSRPSTATQAAAVPAAQAPAAVAPAAGSAALDIQQAQSLMSPQVSSPDQTDPFYHTAG